MIDESYLIKLIHECNELRKNTCFIKLDTDSLKISYMPKKNQEFIGYLQGYYEMFRRKKYKITENDSLRANCKKYLKIFREKILICIQVMDFKLPIRCPSLFRDI